MQKDPNEKKAEKKEKVLESIEEPSYDPLQTFLTLEDLEERAKNE